MICTWDQQRSTVQEKHKNGKTNWNIIGKLPTFLCYDLFKFFTGTSSYTCIEQIYGPDINRTEHHFPGASVVHRKMNVLDAFCASGSTGIRRKSPKIPKGWKTSTSDSEEICEEHEVYVSSVWTPHSEGPEEELSLTQQCASKIGNKSKRKLFTCLHFWMSSHNGWGSQRFHLVWKQKKNIVMSYQLKVRWNQNLCCGHYEGSTVGLLHKMIFTKYSIVKNLTIWH